MAETTDNEIRKLTQARFGALAVNYVDSPIHSVGHSLERLIALVEPGPGRIALDVATGGGHVALGLARAGAQVIAGDLTASMLAAARAHIEAQGVPIRYLRHEAAAIPLPDAALDILTCRFAAHHFPDFTGFLRESARVLRPGGLLGIVDQIGPLQRQAADYVNALERLRDPSHVWQYSERAWHRLAREAGFQIRHSEVIGVEFEFGLWTRLQNTSEATALRLEIMLRQAPEVVAAWHEPRFTPGGGITFTHRHLILVAEQVRS